MDFPNFDPVALQIGPLIIRWYALAYLVGFLAGWRYGVYLVSLYKDGTRPNKTDIDDFIPWAILGVIGGGRLGYILFYNFPQYAEHPLDIFKVWQGGMSFHGGVAGIIAALVIFAMKRGFSPRLLADVICCGAPIGLFLGRCANFVNGELFGRVTNVSWGVKFPAGGMLPRHPSQLYEAFLEGIVLFVLLAVLAQKEKIREMPGVLTGIFLIGYGVSRIIVEFFREPDEQLGFIVGHISMGQVLSVPMIVLGACVILYAYKHRKIS